MTREEAVAVLKAFMENPLFSDVHKAAFNIAIHDIKQRHDWDINNLILINKENYEPQTFKWCTDCKEYDQEKHCCHRWSKVIRDTVEEMKQEPFKPMVEIDLYSVIKQKYIEREVLDKIRAEIEAYTDPQGFITISEGRFNSILDKYKAETEG